MEAEDRLKDAKIKYLTYLEKQIKWNIINVLTINDFSLFLLRYTIYWYIILLTLNSYLVATSSKMNLFYLYCWKTINKYHIINVWLVSSSSYFTSINQSNIISDQSETHKISEIISSISYFPIIKYNNLNFFNVDDCQTQTKCIVLTRNVNEVKLIYKNWYA
jgi:hypothetical protein